MQVQSYKVRSFESLFLRQVRAAGNMFVQAGFVGTRVVMRPVNTRQVVAMRSKKPAQNGASLRKPMPKNNKEAALNQKKEEIHEQALGQTCNVDEKYVLDFLKPEPMDLHSLEERGEILEEFVSQSRNAFVTKTKKAKNNLAKWMGQRERQKKQRQHTKELQRQLKGGSYYDALESLNKWKSPPGGLAAFGPDVSNLKEMSSSSKSESEAEKEK